MALSLVLGSGNEERTAELAAGLAQAFLGGDVLALVGELGTGKTRFVEGAARALGYRGRVRSPSFTLLNVYRGRMPIYHFDLYRWESGGRDAEQAEWLEYLEGEGVSFIEWAERWGGGLPERTIHVSLFHEGGTRRRIEVTAPPGRLSEFRVGLGLPEGR